MQQQRSWEDTMLLFENASPDISLSSENLKDAVAQILTKFGSPGNMLIVPPDITRLHSRTGELTQYIYKCNTAAVRAIMPALGTHRPMDADELRLMFGEIPRELFYEHRWRSDCVKAGVLSSGFVGELSEGKLDFEIPIWFNGVLFDKRFDCVVSLSQVVPHEVAGMAGFTKNIAVGLGGSENIHKSHFLGAVFGMERIMGRPDSPVRKVLNEACSRFLDIPVIHIITVLGMDTSGALAVRGIFAGTDDECYQKAAALSRRVNVHLLDKPIQKAVVYLDPVEFKSTWLGNKSIYRTRMAIADGGELIVLAPGVRQFGEDPEIDRLIRKFGYRGTGATLAAVKQEAALQENLSAAAHLVHGSSDDRFTITYAAGGLTPEDVENAGFKYADVNELIKKYCPETLAEGYNQLRGGEEIYYISKPGSGLWACREKFGE